MQASIPRCNLPSVSFFFFSPGVSVLFSNIPCVGDNLFLSLFIIVFQITGPSERDRVHRVQPSTILRGGNVLGGKPTDESLRKRADNGSKTRGSN